MPKRAIWLVRFLEQLIGVRPRRVAVDVPVGREIPQVGYYFGETPKSESVSQATITVRIGTGRINRRIGTLPQVFRSLESVRAEIPDGWGVPLVAS